MLRAVRSIGSGGTSDPVQTDRRVGFLAWGILFVFIALQALILRCAFVPNEWGLLGGQSKLFGRYTSTRTLHVLQVPSVNELMDVQDVSSVPAVPSNWNSLGMIIPFEDETYLQTNAVHISKVYSPPTTEFIDPKKTGTFYNRCNRINTNHIEGVFHTQCELEHLQNAALITNGDSMSVLTEITPGLYMITLLTIYWLSIVQWTSETLAAIFESCSPYWTRKGTQKLFSTVLYTVIGIWYFAIIVNAFTDLNRMYLLDMLGSSVYFRVTSHLPSILVNVFILLLYILHLRGRHLSFGFTHYGKVDSEEPKAVEPVQIPTVPPIAQIGHLNQSAQAAPFTQQQMHLNMKSFGMHGPTGFGNQTRLGTSQGSDAAERGPCSCFIDMLRRCFGAQCCVPNMASLDAAWNADYRHGNKVYGPVTSEASVLLAVTLILGGIACASIGKGMTMEIEIQMVLVAVLAYSLLELGMEKTLKYYEYMKEHYRDLFANNASYVVFAVVRVIVLFLQSIILVLWSNSMDNINSRENAIFLCIWWITGVYWALRLATLVAEVWQIFYNQCLCCSWASGDFKEGVYYFCEFVWPILLLFVIVIAVFVRSDDRNNSADKKHEQTVLKYDKLLYGHMYDVDANAACGSNFRSSSLLYSELVNDFEQGADKTPKFTYGSPYEDVSETFTTLDQGKNYQNYSAVDMKVFYWTRRWRQHSARPVKANTRFDSDLFYCTAGFERHWGICKSALTEHDATAWVEVTSLPTAVKTKIPTKTKWISFENEGDGSNHAGKNHIKETLEEDDKY